MSLNICSSFSSMNDINIKAEEKINFVTPSCMGKKSEMDF